MLFRKTLLSTQVSALAAASMMHPTAAMGQQNVLEEVLVTATRRSESVQDIPYNISAISGDSIRRQGAFDVNDITRGIPGVAGPDLGSRSGINNSVIMRGINVSDPGQGTVTRNLTVAAVSTYVNETPLFTNFRMVDLDRVEVLRGPQGTLYGSGAMGGTLRFITKRPDLDARSFDVTAGLAHNAESSELNYELQGIVNVPLSDTLALRAAVAHEDRGGVVDANNLIVLDNGLPARVDPANPDSAAQTRREEDVDSGEILFARMNMLWAPSDETEVNINYLRQDEEWGHSTTAYIGADASIGGGADSYQDSSRYLDEVDRTVDLISLDVQHDFGFATFTSSTSYSADDSNPNRDTSDFYETLGATYYLGYPRINALDVSSVETDVFTQELRLVSNGDGPFDWTVGAYYQQEDVEQNNSNRVLGYGEWSEDPASGGSQIVAYYYAAYGFTTVGDFVEFGLGGTRPSSNNDLAFVSSYESEFTDLAAFAELTWHATDQWQFTLGARVFRQEVDAVLFQSLPYCGAGCADDGADPLGTTRANSSQSFNDQIFKFNTSYDINDDLMVYLTVSEGFRRGGANALPQSGPFFDPGFSLAYEPDTLLNSEIGIKGYAWDRRVNYTLSAYTIAWDDIQLETFNAAGFRGVVNGREAESTGVELEVTASVSESLTITAGYSYVDAEISEGATIADRSIAGLPNDVLQDGDPLPYVPENQASISIDYDRLLSNGMTFSAHLDGNYRSDFNSQVNDTLFFDNFLVFDSYSQWNASLSVARDSWRATLWSRNLSNEEGLSSAIVRNSNVAPSAEFGRRGFVSRPRTIGLRLSYYFD